MRAQVHASGPVLGLLDSRVGDLGGCVSDCWSAGASLGQPERACLFYGTGPPPVRAVSQVWSCPDALIGGGGRRMATPTSPIVSPRGEMFGGFGFFVFTDESDDGIKL